MNQDWILQTNEIRRTFSSSTWIPLRASHHEEQAEASSVGYISEFFGCGSVAFPPQYREIAERLDWSDIGIGRNVQPYAYRDGNYSPIDQFQYNDKDPIGVQLVFEHPQPVLGGSLWILNPDLIVALRLIKDGNNWVRPEEDFCIVAREVLNEKGHHTLIEIKREFLIDYLAARNLSLRLSYYRQRVENVTTLEDSEYTKLVNVDEEREGGRFTLLIRSLENVYGGSWSSMRVWRTDIDENEDAPVMELESDENTSFENSHGYIGGYKGVRVEGEFWRNEWIEHQRCSLRVRGDTNKNLPQFIVETDGTRIPSANLCNEDIGRWLWFHPAVVNELLSRRGFSLEWYTSETGGIRSTSGYVTHFGINPLDLITVYAYDIARLSPWEQNIWAAHNTPPDGKVSSELLLSQVKARPAGTRAAEDQLFINMRLLEESFRKNYNTALYTHDIDDAEIKQFISRFACKDQASLLRLAKELIRIFSDRLNIQTLRSLSTSSGKERLASNKLLEDILSQNVDPQVAHRTFGRIAGTYEMRVGDAHPTSSRIDDALALAEIKSEYSYLRQGEQLISNFGESILQISKLLSKDHPDPQDT